MDGHARRYVGVIAVSGGAPGLTCVRLPVLPATGLPTDGATRFPWRAHVLSTCLLLPQFDLPQRLFPARPACLVRAPSPTTSTARCSTRHADSQ
jgi:hypothetical protein